MATRCLAIAAVGWWWNASALQLKADEATKSCGIPTGLGDRHHFASDRLYPKFLADEQPDATSRLLREVALPHPISSPKLSFAHSNQIFVDEPMNPSEVKKNVELLPNRNHRRALVSVHYQKTGYHFVQRLMRTISSAQKLFVCDYSATETEKVQQFQQTSSFGKWFSDELDIPDRSLALIGHVSPQWRRPQDTRMVHWYRNPVDFIVSSYKANSEIESAQAWEKTPGQCHMCDAKSSEAIFEVCQNNCNYFQLLKSLDLTAGVGMEAINQRVTLNNMVKNLGRWSNDPNVLHLTLAHVEKDFNATVQCILRFYGLPTNGTDEGMRFLEAAQEANANEPGRLWVAGRSRSTLRAHSNTTTATSWLTEHPIWGGDFQTLKATEEAISRRQHRMYGCPIVFGLEEDIEEEVAAPDQYLKRTAATIGSKASEASEEDSFFDRFFDSTDDSEFDEDALNATKANLAAAKELDPDEVAEEEAFAARCMETLRQRRDTSRGKQRRKMLTQEHGHLAADTAIATLMARGAEAVQTPSMKPWHGRHLG